MAENEQDKRQPPYGTSPASVDDKGRLKIPPAFREFVESEPSWFVTSLDGETLRLYALPVWQQVREALRSEGDEGNEVASLADQNGLVLELDKTDRILTPREWRKKHSLERIPVHMHWTRDHIVVLTDEQFEAYKRSCGNH